MSADPDSEPTVVLDEPEPTLVLGSTRSVGISDTSGMKRQPEPGRVSIRARLGVSVIVLVALALTLVGVILFAVQLAAVESQAVVALSRSIEEFETLATEGVDPRTGSPFDGPSRLLEVALQRTALGPTEGEIGVVNGVPTWTAPSGVTLRPENDHELMSHLLPMTDLDRLSSGELQTTTTRYSYAVMPVVFEASPDRGALIRVIDLRAEQQHVNQVMRIYVLVAFGSLLLVAAFTWLIAGRLLRPIEWLRKAADSIGEDDLTTRVPVIGSDDLAALTVTMNGMLDRVQESVEAQRRLMDDVGHELRTPLTVVRGHLELMDVNDPADVESTQILAIDELDRMGGLVTDLLTLAKSDGPDFVVREWTDVALLTDTTLEKARALGDHRWRLANMAEVDAWLDPARITQAWLQLAANASKYSDPGTTIELGSTLAGDEVHLWVRDQGIGVAADDMDLIRSRFGRALAGRTHTDGVGLGLAIVGSIVRAHNGRLDIESVLGAGSTFTMVLPLTSERKGANEQDLDH